MSFLRRRVTACEKTLMIAELSGGAWRRVAVRLVAKIFGFCTSKSLEDLCGLIFCEILSEILEIRDGNPQASLNLLPF